MGGSPRPRAAVFRAAVALVVASCVIAGAAAVTWRLELLQWLTRREARLAGLEEKGVSVRAERFDGRALALADLRVGDTLAVDHIRATYDLGDLLSPRLATLEVSGIRLDAQIIGGRLDLGALAPLLTGRSGDSRGEGQNGGLLASLQGVPVGELRVEAATIALNGDYGPFEITGGGRLRAGGEEIDLDAELGIRHARGRIDATLAAQRATDALVGQVDVNATSVATEAISGIELDEASVAATATFRAGPTGLDVAVAAQPFRVTGQLAGEAFALAGSWPALTLSRPWGESGVLIVSGKDGHLAPSGLAAFPFAVDRIELNGRLAPTERWPSGRVAMRLRPCDELADWLPPLAFEARAAPAEAGGGGEGSLTFEVDWELEDHPVKGSLRGELFGGSDSETEIRARIRLDPVTLGRANLRVAEVAPGWAATLQSATGKVELQGHALVRAGVATLAGTLIQEDIGIRSKLGTVEGLSGTLRYDSLVPLLTPPGQMLTMRGVDLGVALGVGSVTFQLKANDQLQIERGEWEFAGGTLRVSGTHPWRSPPGEGNDRAAIDIELERVDLAELLALVDLDGLEGSGRVSGRLPLRTSSGGLEVRIGLLRSEGPGWIRYRDPALATTAKQQGDQSMRVLMELLDNFQFTELLTVMQGPLDSELQFGVQISGSNPDYRDGAPANLNFNVLARLQDLLRRITAVVTLPSRIEEALLGYQEEAGDDASTHPRCRPG